MKCDDLTLYAGDDIYITDKIIIKQPTLKEIQKFSEEKYFSAVHTLTSVGADLKWQLSDLGIDYTEIEDYDLFIKLISQMVGSKKNMYLNLLSDTDYSNKLNTLTEEEINDYFVNPLELVLNIDFADFLPCEDKNINEIILYNKKDDITIDRLIYHRIVDTVRKIHGFKRNNQIPANEQTKMDLIDDARDEYLASLKKDYKSVLKSLISTMNIKCGCCGTTQIWNMKINAFLYDIKRISKIQDAEALINGAYSGFANLKGIDKNRLDIFADI